MDRDQAVQFMHNLLRAMLSKKRQTYSSPPVFRPPSRSTAK
jgi:hypothetical protein